MHEISATTDWNLLSKFQHIFDSFHDFEISLFTRVTWQNKTFAKNVEQNVPAHTGPKYDQSDKKAKDSNWQCTPINSVHGSYLQLRLDVSPNVRKCPLLPSKQASRPWSLRPRGSA